MATVYLGRLNAAGGVGRIVAVKRLHAQFAKNPDFVRMFLDEARLATRIHHPNVVPTLDVVADEGELFVVMDYIRGESLSKLLRAVTASGDGIPIPIVSSIISGVLQGLDAAHEATDEQGQPLGIVHRDVSPQNILVGEDGMARILDFGVAKAASRLHETQDGQLKGKLAYMAPEQIDGAVTKLCDLYAAGIVLWEALTGRYLFRGKTEGATIDRLVKRDIDPPSLLNEAVAAELDAVVMQALEPKPARRFASAREMAEALDSTAPAASILEVAKWVQTTAARSLHSRQEAEQTIESGADSLSGFPVLGAELCSGELTPPSATSESKTRHSTAVTLRSSPLTFAARTRRWSLLAGLVALAAVTAWILMTGRLARWRGGPEPAAPTAATVTASSQPATQATADSAMANPTATASLAAQATATASEAASAPPVTADAGAKVPVVRRPPPTSGIAPPKPPPKESSSADPNDIDLLIETRK